VDNFSLSYARPLTGSDPLPSALGAGILPSGPLGSHGPQHFVLEGAPLSGPCGPGSRLRSRPGARHAGLRASVKVAFLAWSASFAKSSSLASRGWLTAASAIWPTRTAWPRPRGAESSRRAGPWLRPWTLAGARPGRLGGPCLIPAINATH